MTEQPSFRARGAVTLVVIATLGMVALVAACAEGDEGSGFDAGGGGGIESGGGAGGAGGDSACALDCATLVDIPCLVSVCDETSGTCVVEPEPDGAACDDGQFCTAEDRCQEGLCVGVGVYDCGRPPSACESVVCDEATETCAYPAADEGGACETNDPCTSDGICTEGSCVGKLKDCSFLELGACQKPICNSANGQCEPQPANQGISCQALGNLCVEGGKCAEGECVGTLKDCSQLADECNDAGCEPQNGLCVRIPKAVGTPCTGGECDLFGSCAPTG